MPVYIVAKSITNVDWCWLMLIDSDWSWLVLIDAHWCWLVLIDADWCWLMLICADWCWLVLVDDECCWLMLIDAQIRFNCVFFCRSVPPELLRSFLKNAEKECSEPMENLIRYDTMREELENFFISCLKGCRGSGLRHEGGICHAHTFQQIKNTKHNIQIQIQIQIQMKYR